MSVGVSIKDASGQLKDMDTILDETALRWRTLSKDQQVALAQGVAGIRQYNTFIALMDNWGDMEKNVQTAKDSAGALTQMSITYADSIEAAEKRATASAEGIYDSLFNSKEMKGFYDGLSDIFEVVESLVDAFGGLPGILTLAGSLLMKMYQPKIADFFQKTAFGIKDFGSSIKNVFTKGKFESSRADNIKAEAARMQ
jgi:TP901 family phage tail tape measure protein